jgi:hypothetical protein
VETFREMPCIYYKCATLDKQMDELACLTVMQVHQIYGLTEKEIKIVEESIK